jgi:high affinity Mn2+ porin
VFRDDEKNAPDAKKNPSSKDSENGKDGQTNGVKNGGSANGPPTPRTFPQALIGYWRRLQARPCLEDEAASETPKNGTNGDKNGGNGDARPDKDEPKESWLSAHYQATMDMQHHGSIRSPYTGTFSLSPSSETSTSLTSTLFLDARLWEIGPYSGELVFNPEIAGGKGFSGVNGIAGFTNGEITRVGVPQPTPYFARLYLRQTWGFGGEQETVEDAANVIGGKRDINRFSIMAGKFAFTDVIDNNTYSHDPRTQFTNWSMMYNGAWDYPANVRGYDFGVAMEYNTKHWAIRYGIMGEPIEANGAPIDPRFTRAFGQALEWEGRWKVDDHPGRVRLMAYLNRAHMGDYREAMQAMPVNPDVTATREYRYKYGCGLNFEQEITRDLGAWGRVGWSDGHTESWAFAPIDRTLALGLLLKGRCWARPNDEVGIGAVWNGLAKDHRDYLRAGGNDFSIGDGQLNYGLEKTVEAYYRISIVKGVSVMFNWQYVNNPAYNRDRGPVSVESLVVHFEN